MCHRLLILTYFFLNLFLVGVGRNIYFISGKSIRENVKYNRNISSYSWVGLLGQPSGLAGGRVGTGGRVVWDWVNQYWADLTKNALFLEKRSCSSILAISGPSRPQKWIRLEILRRIHWV